MEEHVLIWARPERAAKGPPPSRRREQVAAAAVHVADAEGLSAVSVRNVAARLGIGATSLYQYIQRKDELYDLMVDWVEGEDGDPPELTGDWRSDLSGLAHKIRRSILRHPWMASVAAGRPNFGPNSLTWAEYGLTIMDGEGLSVDEMFIASEILQSFVRGFVTRELAEQQALRAAGLSKRQWERAVTPYLYSVLQRGQHPRLGRVITDAALPHAENRQQSMFNTGLERVLDGLLPAHRKTDGKPPTPRRTQRRSRVVEQ